MREINAKSGAVTLAAADGTHVVRVSLIVVVRVAIVEIHYASVIRIAGNFAYSLFCPFRPPEADPFGTTSCILIPINGGDKRPVAFSALPSGFAWGILASHPSFALLGYLNY